MANEIFVDTSGFYALLIPTDDRHDAAQAILRTAQRRKRGFVTTDYVLDETATLLKARGCRHLLPAFFARVDGSHACRTEWMDAERFADAKTFFLKHDDQDWSFTDCVSFLVMKRCRLRDALTRDGRFQDAGFVALLK